MAKTAIASIWLVVALLAGCQSMEQAKESNKALAAPVNCATAEGDLRVLEGEKAYVAERRAAGASTVAPVSQVYGGGPTGGVTGYEPNPQQIAGQQMSIQMQIDGYQEAVEKKIAEIKATCGL